MDQKDVAVRNSEVSAESLIAQAIKNNTPVETMEKLLAMRRELKAEFAKEQFDQAMARFQGECPVIKKDKEGGKTNSGSVAYYYAPLDSIVTQTKEMIRQNGFSYAIQTQTFDSKVKVTCIVKHEAGHSESSDVEVPLGTKTQVMSASQVVASALTFAKRYAFCNAFGILTGDDDDDSNKTKDPIAPKRELASPIKTKIVNQLKSLGIDAKKFTREELSKEVEIATRLPLEDQNLEEISSRLEAIISERDNNK